MLRPWAVLRRRVCPDPIFYRAPDQTLMALDVKRNQTTVEFSPPKALFPTRIKWMEIQAVAHHYAAAPDGQRFLISSATDEARSVQGDNRAQLVCGLEEMKGTRRRRCPFAFSVQQGPANSGTGRHKAKARRHGSPASLRVKWVPVLRSAPQNSIFTLMASPFASQIALLQHVRNRARVSAVSAARSSPWVRGNDSPRPYVKRPRSRQDALDSRP